MLNMENGYDLKIRKLKRKRCLRSCVDQECIEPRNLLFLFVLFLRANREEMEGKPFAEIGHHHRPREQLCRQNIYNATNNRNPRN